MLHRTTALLLAALLLGACSSEADPSADPVPSASTSVSTSAPAAPQESESAAPAASDDSEGSEGAASSAAAGTDPSSPFVVAAAAVATRSREQVVSLHAMGVSTTTDTGIPHAELPAQGEAISQALQQEITDATQLPPPDGSPAAALVAALRAYGGLAGQLADWDPQGAALPQRWFTKLAATDERWQAALGELSTLSGQDLLADLPELILPES
jgi:hypothetical protein